MKKACDALSLFVSEESIDYIRDNYKSVRELFYQSEKELQKIPNIGPKKAKQLKSIMALSEELLAPLEREVKISRPDDIYICCRDMALLREEHFVVLLLDTQNRLIKKVVVSKGILNASIAHPREIFAHAIENRAHSIVIVHNHPSGDTEPSDTDIDTTKRIEKAGDLLGIPLLDHVIIGNGYTSLKERGYF